MTLAYIIFVLTLIAVMLLACLIGAFLLALSAWESFFTKAPFVSVKKEILGDIVSALKINPDSVVYDLGCGEGRVLIACAREHPNARYIGLDKDLIPFWSAKWKTRNTPVTILREDFFKHDLSNATHVFVYLFPALMNELLPKFQKELRPGTRVVSCDFQFTDKKPTQTIDLNRQKYKLGKFLHIYEF